mgnify:CR=1 FL=1
MPDFKPYIVIGLALGGVYAMSGVGLVVLVVGFLLRGISATEQPA